MEYRKIIGDLRRKRGVLQGFPDLNLWRKCGFHVFTFLALEVMDVTPFRISFPSSQILPITINLSFLSFKCPVCRKYRDFSSYRGFIEFYIKTGNVTSLRSMR